MIFAASFTFVSLTAGVGPAPGGWVDEPRQAHPAGGGGRIFPSFTRGALDCGPGATPVRLGRVRSHQRDRSREIWRTSQCKAAMLPHITRMSTSDGVPPIS